VNRFQKRQKPLPALFVGHGSPMYAVSENPFSRSWAELGHKLPRPEAILCISAHWESDGVQLSGAEKPPTIHDFTGFPQTLFDVEYPAPGSPELAALIAGQLHDLPVIIDHVRGLDHGAWSVLKPMFPQADIPVVQLSLDRRQSPEWHYRFGHRISSLRYHGVLVVGSGNIVHNLSDLIWQEGVHHEWAVRFDAAIAAAIEAGDHETVIHYNRLGEDVRRAVPTPEHFLPLLYVLAMQQPQDRLSFFNAEVGMGSISMRSLVLIPG